MNRNAGLLVVVAATAVFTACASNPVATATGDDDAAWAAGAVVQGHPAITGETSEVLRHMISVATDQQGILHASQGRRTAPVCRHNADTEKAYRPCPCKPRAIGRLQSRPMYPQKANEAAAHAALIAAWAGAPAARASERARAALASLPGAPLRRPAPAARRRCRREAAGGRCRPGAAAS